MRKKLNISDWTSLTLVTIIWVGWQIQNDRERCVKTVSCMGILLFSSTKYIPSDNSTLCHAVALAAAETRRKKKNPNQNNTYAHKDLKRTSWSFGALVSGIPQSSDTSCITLSNNAQTQQTYCSQVTACISRGKSPQESDTQQIMNRYTLYLATFPVEWGFL